MGLQLTRLHSLTSWYHLASRSWSCWISSLRSGNILASSLTGSSCQKTKSQQPKGVQMLRNQKTKRKQPKCGQKLRKQKTRKQLKCGQTKMRKTRVMIPSENEEGATRWRKTEKEAAKTIFSSCCRLRLT